MTVFCHARWEPEKRRNVPDLERKLKKVGKRQQEKERDMHAWRNLEEMKEPEKQVRLSFYRCFILCRYVLCGNGALPDFHSHPLRVG